MHQGTSLDFIHIHLNLDLPISEHIIPILCQEAQVKQVADLCPSLRYYYIESAETRSFFEIVETPTGEGRHANPLDPQAYEKYKMFRPMSSLILD
ncbi:hypothetical protein K474DRAFT_60020 [Panus rudis PR-1116 ss-1]|nr:hypothetical protein K474DRAFT_60020 [Panus rudis PR-1116 ss-1]